MKQLLLFSLQRDPMSHRADPITSNKAAEKVVITGLAASHRMRILASLASGAKTGKEIAEDAELDQVAVMRRMHELVKAGQVRATGKTKDNQQIWEKPQ